MVAINWDSEQTEDPHKGFLHRHKAKPGYPEMKKHVVVDLVDWEIVRKLKFDIVAAYTELMNGQYEKCGEILGDIKQKLKE